MSPRQPYPDRITCQLHGGVAIGDAVAAARGFGEARRLGSQDLARLCIVVEELVANLYDHGGLTDADGVELSLASDPGGIRITITDTAAPFDLRSAPSSPDPAEGGAGAGLDLVRAWTNLVDYRTTDEGNRLELLLPLAASE